MANHLFFLDGSIHLGAVKGQDIHLSVSKPCDQPFDHKWIIWTSVNAYPQMLPCHFNRTLDQPTHKQQLEATPCPIPHSNLRPTIHKYILPKWQAEWSDCSSNKLYEISPLIKDPKPTRLEKH